MPGLLNSEQQIEVSEQRRMPVDSINSDALAPITGDVVQFYYYTAGGVQTTDAGQVAGVVIVGKLANRNILSELGDVVGTYGDTSLAWTTGTTLVTLKPYRATLAESVERTSSNVAASARLKAIAVTEGFGNGDYC